MPIGNMVPKHRNTTPRPGQARRPGLEMKPPSLGVETTKRRKHHLCHWDPVVPNLRFGGTGVGAMFGSSRAVPEVRYDWIPRVKRDSDVL